MATEPARYDPPVQRFRPDAELVARVQRHLMSGEDQASPRERFVRQRWEEAVGALRVTVTALREIWPHERVALDDESSERVRSALNLSVCALVDLDDCGEAILGEALFDVLAGDVRSHAELDERGIPR